MSRSRKTVETITCDFCGYHDDTPRLFVAVGDVDLCRWCAEAPAGPGMVSSGAHDVRIGDKGWTCSCGAEYCEPYWLPASVRAALPSVVGASASEHVNRR